MRVAELSTYDLEGGAARAAYRLHRGLLANGLDGRLFVQEKTSDDFTVDGPWSEGRRLLAGLRRPLDRLPVKFRCGRDVGLFSAAWLPSRLRARVTPWTPDLMHLHWITHGFADIGWIGGIDTPVVWTLHDMWAFTGGCHYDSDCGRYRESCGMCPHLGGRQMRDMSYRVWKRKQRSWSGRTWTIVTPSRWLAECAHQSSLFAGMRIEVIPNGLNLDRFTPLDKTYCRSILGLPLDKKLVLFGALGATSDPRKGFEYLSEALNMMSKDGWGLRSEALVLGESTPVRPPELGIQTHYLGRLYDDISLAIVYAAADVVVVPSTQENLANSVMEALACGTPVVAFNVGGMTDMIEHERNGYLAAAYDSRALAKGIAWVVEEEDRWSQLSLRARKKCEEEFEIGMIAKRHMDLYRDILSSSS